MSFLLGSQLRPMLKLLSVLKPSLSNYMYNVNRHWPFTFLDMLLLLASLWLLYYPVHFLCINFHRQKQQQQQQIKNMRFTARIEGTALQ